MRGIIGPAGLLLAIGVTSGCATVTPDFSGSSETPQAQWLTEQHLVFHIQCQLAKAVHDAMEFDAANSKLPPGRRAAWLKTWGAKVSLVLSINNKNTFSPGLALTDPLESIVTTFKSGPVTTPQNRSFGLGFNWSADATRTETIGFFYSFDDLLHSNIDTEKCKPSIGPYLSSDLKISDFLMKGLDMSFQAGPTITKPGQPPYETDALIRKPGESPYQTFTYDVKFIVTTSGSFTPAWKLVQLSANQSGTLFAASRIRSDDLTITMGKIETDGNGKASPTKELDDQHLANLIGQAVANSLQGRPQQ